MCLQTQRCFHVEFGNTDIVSNDKHHALKSNLYVQMRGGHQ